MWRHRRAIRDFENEIRAHIELETERLIGIGLDVDEARRRAHLRFGNVTRVTEHFHERGRWTWLTNLLLDLSYALRQLRRSPVFAATAVITLALGIGATTSIFTLIDQVLLQSLPVARPDQLWRIGDTNGCCHASGYSQEDWNFFPWEAYKLFRDNTPAFADLSAFQVGNAGLSLRRTGSAAAAKIGNGEFVSGNFFRTLGISAYRGRVLTDDDDKEGATPVVVMSFHSWQQTYGSDPSVVGSAYQINGGAFIIVGVAPPGFFGVKIDGDTMPDFWLPLTTEPLITGATSRLKNNGEPWLNLIGRIRPGTNPKSLEKQLQTELRQWLASHVPDMTAKERMGWDKETLYLTPGGSGVSLIREGRKDDLRLLMLAAACVLLVACGNTANLLMARSLKERPQTALRSALGASRRRLVSKALAESLVLALLGGALGITVAYAGTRLILRLAFTAWVPVEATPSVPVLFFAFGVSVITALVFGTAPAWMSAKAVPINALRDANRSVYGRRGVTAGAQKVLVIFQAAAALVLLSAAVMLGQSLRNLERQNFGFDSSGRYLVGIDPKTSNYKLDQLETLFQQIETQLGAIPGVRKVGGVLEAPRTGWVVSHDIRIESKPEADESAGSTRVTPGFFESVGDKIVAGRAITDNDTADTTLVAVVNQSFVKRFFGNENPIGQRFAPDSAAMYEIVGVAADVDFVGGMQPLYFVPEAQTTHFDNAAREAREVWSHYLYSIVIWAPGDPPNLEKQVKIGLAAIDPNLLTDAVQPYSQVIKNNFSRQYLIASLTSLFSAVGLVLAAVGLYGVTAYGVEQRAAEIGMRIALGAEHGSVVRMILRGAFVQIGIGLAFGIPAAIGAGHLIESQLFGVKPWDPFMLFIAAALLGLAALTAAFVPARRAASLDPMQALRAE